MCNNILQYAHVYAWARECNRHSMSMRFAYKYQYFKICNMKNHNFMMYMLGKYGAKYKVLPVVTYDLGEEGKEQKEKFTLAHKNVIIEGWGVRYYDLFLKYKQEILELFDFKEEIHRKIDRILKEAKADETVKIGVHIRRGDYKTFYNGIYYFLDYAYIHYIKETMALFPGRKFTIIICGNDPHLDKEAYRKALSGVTVLFPNGNPGEDLCVLSECDYLVGPPSSYTLVATMYGKALLHWMENDKAHLTLDSFKDFNTLFRVFDDYWNNPPKPRKKVLFLISRFLDGGIDTVMVEYINNLCAMTDHQVSLAIMLKMPELEVFANRLPDNINIFYLVNHRWLTWYKKNRILGNKKMHFGVVDELFLNPLRRLTAKWELMRMFTDYDVVIDFDSTFGSYMPRRLKAKKICFFHFSFAKEMQRDQRHMMRRLHYMEKYDYVVTLSDAMQQEAVEACPQMKDKFIRIYNSINLQRVKMLSKEPVENALIDKPFVIAVERLEESQKDIATLVKAYRILRERNIQGIPPLYIIGEGNSRKDIERLIKDYRLENDVLLLGFISNPFPWIARAEVLVHSSKFEGLPTILIEALMLDKCIVASDCPTGPREILKDGKAGVLVPVGDSEAFADGIQRILHDKELRENIHNHLKKHKKTFMAEKNIAALEELF